MLSFVVNSACHRKRKEDDMAIEEGGVLIILQKIASSSWAASLLTCCILSLGSTLLGVQVEQQLPLFGRLRTPGE